MEIAFIICRLVLTYLVACYADEKKVSVGFIVVVSLLLSPIIGFLIVKANSK